jgi:phosphoenolpyruvate synthase/pyruvate phosphate dikinase
MQGETGDSGAVNVGPSRPAGQVTLAGVPASPGSVVAEVKVVRRNTPINDFRPGTVLVARTTDPTLIGFMLKASAIVTEIGSRMCHTAIVALEMGIPCVVAVDSLLATVTDGMLVRVDGSAGTISILKTIDAR